MCVMTDYGYWVVEDGSPTCVCGNTPESGGFYPFSEALGTMVEPSIDGDWHALWFYQCMDCGRYGPGLDLDSPDGTYKVAGLTTVIPSD